MYVESMANTPPPSQPHMQGQDAEERSSFGEVSSVWRHPMKSARGQQLTSAGFDDFGMVGDRSWATCDLQRGGIRGAKQIVSLMELSAEFVIEPTRSKPSSTVRISAPGHPPVDSDDPFVDQKLSAMLGHPVTLEALQPPTELDHYRRGKPDLEDPSAALRQVFGRTTNEPLPDLTDFAHIAHFESPPGTYVDAYPVHILTTSSLEALEGLRPGTPLDVRRFRPNLVIALADPKPGFPEQEWIGSTLQIGDVQLEIVTGAPRCVMVTRAFADLPQDRPLLRSIVRDCNQVFGVYARVTRGGRVRAGEECSIAATVPMQGTTA